MSLPFERMYSGWEAEHEAARIVERILGLEPDSIWLGWDWYDSSLEIFPFEGEPLATPAQAREILEQTGCSRFWINYPDGTEQYCGGERKKAAYNRYEQADANRAEARSTERLRQYAEQRKLALERARGCIQGLLARTPVRDVSETLAEIDAALAAEGEGR